MKILSLRFKNINSLSSEHYIDFTSPEYQDSGLFLISGDTGSGKTTILDAISLGLYGRTSRFNKISSTFNPLMSKGKGEMFSEVSFSEKGSVYTSRWSQHRANGRPEGALQSISCHIFDESGMSLNRTKEEWENKIIEITGLTFDKFSKAVMLSQGKFSEFLSLEGNKKAAMLGEITGTEVYSKISKKVYERATIENSLLSTLNARLSDIHLLSSEEIEEKNKKLVVIGTKVEDINREISQIDDALQYRGRKEALGEREALLTSLNENIKPLFEKKEKEKREYETLSQEREEREKLLFEVDCIDKDIASTNKNIEDTERDMKSITTLINNSNFAVV